MVSSEQGISVGAPIDLEPVGNTLLSLAPLRKRDTAACLCEVSSLSRLMSIIDLWPTSRTFGKGEIMSFDVE